MFINYKLRSAKGAEPRIGRKEMSKHRTHPQKQIKMRHTQNAQNGEVGVTVVVVVVVFGAVPDVLSIRQAARS